MGGALQQKELIESIQTTPCEPQNAKMHRIKDKLSKQPENSCTPSKQSHRKVKTPEVCKIYLS
jgi:hypothetical protein